MTTDNVVMVWRTALILSVMMVVAACSHRAPPAQIENACSIFSQYPNWRRATERAERRWGISQGTQLAFVNRESSFVADARPPRTRRLFVLPGPRASSAHGYAQALDSTWDWYREQTGNRSARRTDFGDAVDFIGWYASMSQRLSRISLDDPRNLYLAYHEGHTGYNRGSYNSKAWLLRAATQVQTDARRYDSQLNSCQRRRWFR
ncbi:MAG: putative lipoprotein [Oceanicaulis sp. HLUCCA04]|nr:MAG: putative lipoprotein [Oceanicaulis sp. HLUCCA04]